MTNINVQSNERGFSLVETMAAFAVFSLATVSTLAVVAQGVRQVEESALVSSAMIALRDMVAEIQDTANQPQDLSQQKGIGSVYGKYHGKVFSVAELPGAQISVTCFANEATVPANLGGAQDLNFDGDASDRLDNVSNGSDLRLVPVSLTLNLPVAETTLSVTIRRLFTKTTD